MTIPGYNIRKASQVAAFFALKEGGKINVLKLTKLIYLSDRLHLEKYDTPILFDKLVSMEHGPVNSITYNYIKGCLENPDWNTFISDRSGHEVGVANKEISIESLDELSDAETSVLEDIWRQYGHLDRYQIRDFTHVFCKEWIDPEGSSLPIAYEMVFKFLGKENSAMLAQAIEEERLLKRAWE